MMMASSVFSSLRQAAICDVEIGVRARDGFERAAARGDEFLAQRGDRLAPRRRCRRRFIRSRRLSRKQRQRAAGRAGDQKIGLEIAERILRLQRIGRDVDDLGVAARRHRFGNPRHRRVEHQHDVGPRQQRLDVEAEIHRMIGRQVEVVRLALHHRQRELFGQRRERCEGFRRAAQCRRHDQRELRAGEQIGRLIDRLLATAPPPWRRAGDASSRRGAVAASDSTSRGSVR